ncbi:polygalacturonase-like [Manihot esculenta]|uniref:polygalacturonase-like n=1 Tax=Manihot esculenta TaxID=3983 RepID=UPI001CC3B333|nr:polygalacturonase-like [Manihot esculenta]
MGVSKYLREKKLVIVEGVILDLRLKTLGSLEIFMEVEKAYLKSAYVLEVTIDGAEISGTTNGVRIKTWQGGSGIAKNIKFQNIEMHNVSNPIIINQYYCDHHKPCKEQKSAVKVKNVMYKNIKGTSATEVAIKFDCSKAYPCQDILLQHYKKTGWIICFIHRELLAMSSISR